MYLERVYTTHKRVMRIVYNIYIHIPHSHIHEPYILGSIYPRIYLTLIYTSPIYYIHAFNTLSYTRALYTECASSTPHKSVMRIVYNTQIYILYSHIHEPDITRKRQIWDGYD